mmetsp:Transcript_85118/g.214603  ORF Transcript_85118/g.214603 Transcript_85118/m.214603 type:complete len:398 (-) Transcript_85118:218-1411(-)
MGVDCGHAAFGTPSTSSTDLDKPTDFSRCISPVSITTVGTADSIWTGFSEDIELSKSTDLHLPPLRVWRAIPTPGVLKKHYKLQQHIGAGSFGSVVVGKCLRTGRKRAVKTVTLESSEAQKVDEHPMDIITPEKMIALLQLRSHVVQELSIAGKLQHPYIAYLHETFFDDQRLYLIQELCVGGDLVQKMRRHSRDLDKGLARRGLPMEQVAKYMWQMLSGIAYLHHHGFVHRDIKLESYLLKSRTKDSPLKLTDFGQACKIESGVPLTERLGRPAFMAPEVLRGSYNSKCDIYGIGVCSFYLVTARLPYSIETDEDVLEQALYGELKMDPEEWFDVPQEARSLIREILEAEPIIRPSARDVLERKGTWLRQHGHDPEGEIFDHAPGGGGHKACCTIC